MASSPARTCALVVNYRTPRHVCRLLESLWAQSCLVGIVVVDNNSDDGSVQRISEFVDAALPPVATKVCALPRNGGFAYGNNRAVEIAVDSWPAVEFFLVCNPDTLAGVGAVEALQEFAESRQQAGIVGARVMTPNGAVSCAAHIGDGPLTELARMSRIGIVEDALSSSFRRVYNVEAATRCDWVSGAAMLLRRECFSTVGPMDEEFFLYFEEIDYCRRARRRGYEVWHFPRAEFVHEEGASTGITSGRRPDYWFRSRRRHYVKHWGGLALLAADCACCLGWAVGRVCDVLLRRGSGHSPERFIRDLVSSDLQSLFRVSSRD